MVDALRRPGDGLRETHVSWVLLTGDRALKLKKAVRFPFLDYGTLDRRRACCEAEVALNRRLAPATYLGVRSIVPADGGVALAGPDDPRALEYAVEMRRFDEGSTLAARVHRGDLPPGAIASVGARLAAFHAEAEPAPDVDSPAALARRLDETLDTLGGLVTGDDDRRRLASCARSARAGLDRWGGELRARSTRGLVRDVHGDLRCEHVLLDDGIVSVVDCIEFDPALRRIDVGADLAFLLMDLEDHGAPQLARELVAAYRAAGGDPGPDALLDVLAADRALTRAKVALLRARQLEDPEARSGAQAGGARLLRLAERLGWRSRLPLVLAVCGPPASGKSTLATALAEASGLECISSDVVRKELAGISPTARGGPGAYAPRMTARVYAELARRAAAALAAEGGVIVDATYGARARRDELRAAVGDAALAWVLCEVPEAVALARATARERAPGHVSDAGPEVAAALSAAFEPLHELPAGVLVTVDATRPAVGAGEAVAAFLDARSS